MSNAHALLWYAALFQKNILKEPKNTLVRIVDHINKDKALHHLIRPHQGVEQWISEGWELLDDQEKAGVEERVAHLFADGVPLELKHDKIIYIYIFTLLSQLEIVALQLPIRALPRIKDKALKALMRQQLVDEVFHAIVFSKIAYELCAPYSFPPEHNQCIEDIRVFIRDEEDVGTAVVLLNLIAESWFEELLDLLGEKNIAPKVFDVIIEDERRHVAEAELYTDIGLPSQAYLQKKVRHMETELMGDLFFQQKYATAMLHALQPSGCAELVARIYAKHTHQLAKIDMHPDKRWVKFIGNLTAYLDEKGYSVRDDEPVPISTTRKALIAAWKPPIDPTMFSMFSLNVTRLEVFENKYPPQTLTGLVLQAMSKLSFDNPNLRNYVSHHHIYNIADNYIHLVVGLPGATSHLSMLKLKNAHLVSLQALSLRIQNYIEIMSYARYKSEELAQENPKLLENFYNVTVPDHNDVFQDILLPNGMISLTNVAPWGGEQSLSPLLPYEVLKLTMSQVERKQVWNNRAKTFEIQDRLPMSLSADHRVFDANVGTPKMLQIALDEMIDKLEQNAEEPEQHYEHFKPVDIGQFVELTNRALEEDMTSGFFFLMTASHCWQSDLDIDALYQKVFAAIEELDKYMQS